MGVAHILRGLYFLSSGRASAAVSHLRLALIYDETSAYVHERLALAWGASGDVAHARRALQAGLQQHPDDPLLNLRSGRLALAEWRWSEAEAHLRKCTDHPLTSSASGPLLVQALLWQGRLPDAVRQGDAARQRAPGQAEVALELAAAYEDHGALTQSLAMYRHVRVQHPALRAAAEGELRVLDLLGRPHDGVDSLISLFQYYPDAPDLYVALTRLMRRLGAPDQALYRGEALRQTEANPEGRLLVAIGDVAEGERQEGTALLRQILAEYPDHTAARQYLAEVLGGLGDPQGCLAVLPDSLANREFNRRTRAWCFALAGDAEAMLRELKAAWPDETFKGDVLLDAARGLASLLDQDRATQRFESWCDVLGVPANVREVWPEVLLAKAELDAAFGHFDRALLRVRQAEQQQQGDNRLRARLADALVRAGDADAGLALLRALVRESPEDPARLNALGFTLADQNRDLDEAAVWLRRAHRLAPEDGYVSDSLGWLLFRQGQFQDALVLVTRAANAVIGDPEILRHQGDVLRALHRDAEARVAYEQALRSHPSSPLRVMLQARLAEYGARTGPS